MRVSAKEKQRSLTIRKVKNGVIVLLRNSEIVDLQTSEIWVFNSPEKAGEFVANYFNQQFKESTK